MGLTKAQSTEQAVKSKFAKDIFANLPADAELHQIDSSAFAVATMVEGVKRYIKVSLVLAKADYDVENAVLDFEMKIEERDAKTKETEIAKAKKVAEAEKKKAEKASK
jgi:hypothetical protein